MWGITGVHAEASSLIASPLGPGVQFRIDSPQDGDLVAGPVAVSGTGPPNQSVFLHIRSPGAEAETDARGKTDATGRWQVWGLAGGTEFGGREQASGPYEIYAAGIKDSARSQYVTVYLRDSSVVESAVRRSGLQEAAVEVALELRASHLEQTSLQVDRLVWTDAVSGRAEDFDALATDVGVRAAEALGRLVLHNPQDVRVEVSLDGKLTLEPPTAWAVYYGFFVAKDEAERFYGLPPRADIPRLTRIGTTQMAWRLSAEVDQVPSAASHGHVEQQYLEIRQDGYRPEFVSLDERPFRTAVTLQPVLNKRVAVLGFPAVVPSDAIPGGSELLVQAVIRSLESAPETATFGSFAETAAPMSPFDLRIVLGNEVLRLDDVRAAEQNLDQVDVRVISGEGRFLRRKALDIQYVIRGNYRLIK